MAKLLRMPEVAANVTEAVLQEWTVPGNTPFAAQEVIATVETDKAVVDVEAAEAGVILERLVPAGAPVEVGAPIAVLGEPGEQVDDLAALLTRLGVNGGEDRDAPPVRKFASPLARRLAREAGLAVEEITGTGPGGRVVRRDVETAVANRTVAGSIESTMDIARPVKIAAAYTEVPHSRIRQATAARLTESKRTAPHFYLRGTVRVDKLLKLRTRLNEHGTVRVSVNDLLIKAAALAHVLVPELNVIWTPDAVRSFTSVDISVAVATDRGLVTPVVTAVEGRSISSLAAAVRDLVERAKAGRLRQEELDGGTLSVTNLGMFGTEEFAAIINPPQAAILAIGGARPEPVVKKGKLSTATVIRCTLSVDHRAVDGVVAARWMDAFVSTVEHPMRILA
jgi:pyruvate dehydrogenase E2 component (dihydrolipoamide acetyltransferase)